MTNAPVDLYIKPCSLQSDETCAFYAELDGPWQTARMRKSVST